VGFYDFFSGIQRLAAPLQRVGLAILIAVGVLLYEVFALLPWCSFPLLIIHFSTLVFTPQDAHFFYLLLASIA
jgi:hypothetical protein